jgi:hypothetical protein
MRAEQETCPFLMAVVADRLWVSPAPAYCRRPEAPLRVPARASLLRFCWGNYADCDGYQAASARMEGFRD